jgi:hypothetical protein
MKKFYPGSIARYTALSVIAACALMIQVLSGAANSIAFSSTGVICSSNESRSNLPVEEHHHSGFCCILACAPHHTAYIATVHDVATLARRNVSSLQWDLRDSTGANVPLKLNFSARGPPPAL